MVPIRETVTLKLFYGSNSQAKLFFAKDEGLLTVERLGALIAMRNIRISETIPKRIKRFETV
jgi:hypothetical protein